MKSLAKEGIIGYNRTMNTTLLDFIASRVLASLQERMPRLVTRRFLIGLSGGADSAALFYAMLSIQKSEGLSFACVHVNHGLRGAESDEDEGFCRALCEKEGIALTVFQLTGLEKGPGLEQRAREKRYSCFAKAYEAYSADALLTAHHADDQAETLLMHLMRGSGVHGLSGISPDSTLYGMRVLRPMLGILKSEIEAVGLPFRQDATNLVADNLRNALRLLVLPKLNELAPGASARMAQTARLAMDEDGYMEQAAKKYVPDTPYLALKTIQDLHPALLRRVLRLFAGGEGTYELEALVRGKERGTVNLSGGEVAEKGYRYLHLPGRLKPFPPDVSVVEGGVGDGKRMQAIPAAHHKAAVFRHLQAGDVIIPFGMKGHKSMQDYFVDMKVDRPFRQAIPLLCLGKEVLWVPGLGASRLAKVEEAEPRVLLRFNGLMPWATKERE